MGLTLADALRMVDVKVLSVNVGRPRPNPWKDMFGENLTTTGIDVNTTLIGERWRVGPDVLLEVSCPRVPCGTFQGWLARSGWIKRFTLEAKPGP